MSTPFLDKVKLAVEVHPYERVEHGRVEHVGGYMTTLREKLDAGRGRATAIGGVLPEWRPFLENMPGDPVAEFARHDSTVDQAAIIHHMLGAAAAVRAGDSATAVEHLDAGEAHARRAGLPSTAYALQHHSFLIGGGQTANEMRQMRARSEGAGLMTWYSGSPGLGGSGGGHP